MRDPIYGRNVHELQSKVAVACQQATPAEQGRMSVIKNLVIGVLDQIYNDLGFEDEKCKSQNIPDDYKLSQEARQLYTTVTRLLRETGSTRPGGPLT